MVTDLYEAKKKIRYRRLIQLLLISLIILNPLISIIGSIIVFISIYISMFGITFKIDKYIMQFYSGEFRAFQKESKLLSMTHQRMDIFIKSTYFEIRSETDQDFISNYIQFKREVILLFIQCFVSIVIAFFALVLV